MTGQELSCTILGRKFVMSRSESQARNEKVAKEVALKVANSLGDPNASQTAKDYVKSIESKGRKA